MFFYGLDFHHLAPNSILHIAAFITVCEAFLRVEPHFGLWLKVFSIKPKTSGTQLADCGGAMVSKLPKVKWPEGTFMETIKVWQREWFYITEPRAEEPGGGPCLYGRASEEAHLLDEEGPGLGEPKGGGGAPEEAFIHD